MANVPINEEEKASLRDLLMNLFAPMDDERTVALYAEHLRYLQQIDYAALAITWNQTLKTLKSRALAEPRLGQTAGALLRDLELCRGSTLRNLVDREDWAEEWWDPSAGGIGGTVDAGLALPLLGLRYCEESRSVIPEHDYWAYLLTDQGGGTIAMRWAFYYLTEPWQTTPMLRKISYGGARANDEMIPDGEPHWDLVGE